MIFTKKISRFNTILLISIFGTFLSCATPEISVISYNIRYASPNDGVNLWEKRKGDMIESLLNIQPDVMGMQEVVHRQLLDLTSGMKDYSHVGVGREDGETKGEYSPIFFKRQRLELKESNTFWLSETPNEISVGWDAALERICTYARFKDRISKEEFWLFNTHFDHIGKEARANSVRLILSKIEEINQQKLPVVITGDFNLTPDQQPIQSLQVAFEDVQQGLTTESENYGTFTGFNTETVGDQRIDYVFQKGFKVIRADHLWLKTKEGMWVSDHHPVKTDLSIKKLN